MVSLQGNNLTPQKLSQVVCGGGGGAVSGSQEMLKLEKIKLCSATQHPSGPRRAAPATLGLHSTGREDTERDDMGSWSQSGHGCAVCLCVCLPTAITLKKREKRDTVDMMGINKAGTMWVQSRETAGAISELEQTNSGL